MGDSQMNELVESMRKITTSTANIQKVLKMINDIAFQTNILSLNAAVEAARAGQHGKGFAVIAEDVRNLALKSAVAADDTSSMLDEVNLNILQSTEIVQKTAESLAQIVNSTEQTEKLSRDVSHASNEQAIAVNQITLSLEQVSGVVQGTTLSAEKAANTSKLLKESANSLMETISSFKTMDEVVNWDAHNLKISKSFDKKKYVWNESFSVDVNTFDNHHIYLFDLVNDLYNAIEKNQDSLEIKSIFYEIYEYTDYHFTEEEKAMKESNVPNLDAHIKLHRKFKFEISEVLENIDNLSNQKLKDEVLDFLVNWLVKHIKETDQSYSNYMKKAGI
jgi:hemerythrin-like metal-binding protein